MLPLLNLGSAIALLALQGGVAPLDVQRLETYANAWVDTETGSRLEAQARIDFDGRGVDIANHFLVHTGPRPRNDSFFFVLRAVGDADTALALIRALPNPPTHQSGILDRHFGEIAVAIEAVLTKDTVRRDPRIVSALEQSISTARNKPSGVGRHEALEGLRLIGMCRGPDAARVLISYTTDADAEIRTAAANALGQFERAATPTVAATTSPADNLLRLLVSDSSPLARRQAAESLGFVQGAGIEAGLGTALERERNPEVVDAILQALRRRGAPIVDPARCRDLVGRTWDAAVAQQMLECWMRQGASREDLARAALEGAATQRAIALYMLTMPDRLKAPTTIIVDRTTPIPAFEPPVRERLLEETVSVLSQEAAISPSTRDIAEHALWNLSAESMDRAAEYADRVTPYAARYRASAALARADARAYDAMRRRQQAAAALVIALAFLLLMVPRSRLRRPALLLAMSAAGWALWTFWASGVRSLPPPPRQALTVEALAFFSAGATTGFAALRRHRARTVFATLLELVLTAIGAAVFGALICYATRSSRLFPSDLGGWELIFDPMGTAVLAGAIAVVLFTVNRGLPLRQQVVAR